MNDLSWLLYIADVANDLDGIIFVMAGVAAICCFFWGFAVLPMAAENASADDWKSWRSVGKSLVPTTFLLFVISAIVPEKETIYAVAASEMGETALNTETGNKAVKALNSWLDRQIKPDKVE